LVGWLLVLWAAHPAPIDRGWKPLPQMQRRPPGSLRV